jgi:hypothetical protein
MGRHSSAEQWHFYRSVAAWFLPWALLSAVIGTAVWVAIDTVGNDDIPTPVVADATSSPTEVEASPTDSPTPEPTQTRPPKTEPTKSPMEQVELITEGMNVQILNGTNVADADDRMADRLTRLGFRVEAVNPATARPLTTVFWSFPEAEEAARRLAERFGWVAEPKPENLSATVALHVVVGDDEA